jgi:hypothetical protein
MFHLSEAHRGGTGSSPGLVMWALGWTKWRWQGFLRVLRFPLPNFIPPIAPQSPSSIIGACTIGQKWPQYLVDSVSPPLTIIKIKKISEAACYVSEQNSFYGMKLLAQCPIPNVEDQVSLLVWTLLFDFSGMGDPTGS